MVSYFRSRKSLLHHYEHVTTCLEYCVFKMLINRFIIYHETENLIHCVLADRDNEVDISNLRTSVSSHEFRIQSLQNGE